MKIVWTYSYDPFIMGGNVWRPIATAVDPLEIKEVSDIPLFSFITPKGTIKIAEGITGAIVGTSFEEVEHDIISASLDTITEQMVIAKEDRDRAKVLSNKEFFDLYKY